MAQVKIKQPPPSAVLIRHLERLERDLAELDLVLGDNPAKKRSCPTEFISSGTSRQLDPTPNISLAQTSRAIGDPSGARYNPAPSARTCLK